MPNLPKPEEVLGSALPSPSQVLGQEAPKPAVKTQSTDEIIGAIEGISEGEKAIIKGLTDKRVDNETLSNSILTLQGKHPKQAGHKGYYIKDGVPVPLAKFQVPKDEKLAASVFSEKDLPQELSDSFDRGLIRLGKGIAKAPEFLVDLGLEATWNKTMRDIGRKDLEYTAKEFGADTESIGKYMNIPLKESVDVMNKSLEKRDEDYQKVYQKGVVDYFNQGDYAKAGSVLANSIVESAPTTIALAMTGGGTGMVLGGGAVFGAQKLDELEKNNPDLTKEEKLGVATANGLLEGIFEQWGITKIGAIAKDIIKKEGKDVAAKYIEDVVRGAYEPAMKKYFGAVAEESLGEMATQISQNAVDKFSGVNPDLDLMDGVLDAGIIGLGASVGPSVLTSAAEKDKVTKSNEQSKFIYDRVKKGPEEVNAFKAEIENAASNGLLTGEEAEKAKFQADVYSQYYEQTKDMDLGDEQKRKIYDLSYQKQGLETELKGINKDELNPIELGKYNAKAKQAKDIQSDIDNLMLGAEVKKETVAGEKTISDLSKPEKKEEEKVDLSPELQAINDRYKEETGFLPEKEVQRRLKAKEPIKMTEVKPTQFNEKRYNHREKFKQVAEHIDSTPEGRESGVLKVVDFTDPSGKKGKRIEVELPTGHRIWMSSSMAREGSDIMGHFREEHLPKNTSGKRAYEMMEDFPVKMKLVTTREGATGDNTAIKVYNAKTGKIIGWAKATTKGEDILTQPIISADEKFKGKPGITKAQYDAEVKRREDLAREEMIDRIEPVDGGDMGGQLTTTPVTPKGPVKPVTPTKVTSKTEQIQKDDAVWTSKVDSAKTPEDIDNVLNEMAIANQKTIDRVDYALKRKEVLTPKKKTTSTDVGSDNYKNKTNQHSGRTITKTLPNGEKVRGTFKLVEVDDVLASHNENNFSQTENFPKKEDGSTLNDRDYERDTNAQKEVVRVAQDFDSRAVTNTPTVTKDGVIVDGNNRTMSRKLAAQNNTDAEYVDALKDQAEMYGFTAEQVEGMNNPYLVFEMEGDVNYTTDLFSKFNKAEKKEKSPIDKAIEIAKTITDRSKSLIAELYQGVDNPSDVTSNPKKIRDLIKILQSTGIIQPNELPRYFDIDNSIATKDGVSLMESIVLGIALDEQAIRSLSNEGMGNVKRQLLSAIPQLIKNGALKENSLTDQISSVVKLINSLNALDVTLDDYVNQPDLFGDKQPVTALEYAVAVALTDSGFKKWLNDYNDRVGQMDMFKGDITTKKDILYETIETKTGRRAEDINGIIRDAEGDVKQDDEGTGDDGTKLQKQKSGNQKLESFIEDSINQLKEEGSFDPDLEKSGFYRKAFAQKYQKTVNKPTIEKIVEKLKKSMPKVKVVVDENLTDKDGNPVAGKWDPKTNTVSINPFYADTDTPIHEYGHVLIDAIGRDNKVIKAAIKQLEGTKLWKETKQRYPDLSESNLGVEVLAEAIGREGQGIFDMVTDQSRFKTFLDYIFDWLKTKLGLNKNIAKSLAKQIITGRGTKEMEGVSKEDEFQIVGEKAKLSKQIMEGLKSAKNMESMEYSPEEIRLATGWEKAKDGKWRYEIGDESAQFSDIDGLISSALKITDKDGIVNLGNLNDVFEYNDLYEAYPELKNIKFNIYNGKGFENGYFDPKEGSININVRSLRSGNYGNSVGSIKEQSGNLSKLRGAIIHEAQHATQRIENFNSGGSKESAERYLLEKKGLNKDDYSEKEWSDLVNDAYSKFAGEVEANNAVFRSYLKDIEKKDFSLESTEDVDRAVQILFDINEQYQRPKYKRAEGQEVMSLNDFRETELNRDVEKEKDDINYVNEIIKNKSSTDKERKNAEGLKNTILSRIREDKKKYVDYLDQVRGFEESMDKIVEDDGLEDFTLDELLDIYHNSHYSMDNDSALNKAVKLRIATYLTKEQIKELEKNPLWEQKKGAVNKKDLNGIQLLFKSLADIPEYLPGVQVLGKELNRAALEKMKEIRERGEKLTKLAKAVIKEKNGMLGMLHPKGLFSSDSAKYFEYLDNGKGQLITKEEGKKLGITDAQMAYRDYMQELVDLRNATYDENDEIISNDLMKRDKGFREAWRTEGFLPALAYYLGRGINDDLLVNVKNEQGGYDQKEFSDAQSEILSKTNTFSDKLKAGIKIAKLSYQGKKNKTDAPYMNYKGGLTMKYDKPRPKDKGYSKDFFASGLDLINDYAHVKHMGPLVPLFDSILYLHEKGFDSKLPNVKKFIESEMNDKLYQKQKGFEPTVDATLRFLRRLGSLTTMAFNIPANAVNIFIGNYNNWRQEGLPHIFKGNARLFSSDGKISDKGLDVLKQFDVVKFDAESNPQINGAKLFDKLAYFFNKIGEYQIQGSMFLGHMTNEEWDSFEKNESGEWVLKPGVDKKAFTDKMMSYRDAVSSIQGKYDEKDRRMFMRGEIGKSVAQFKTWMPDWFKSRFGKEFINKYGVTEQGSVTAALRATAHLLGFDVYTKEAIAELKKDFSGNPFNKNGTFKNKQTARNLRGAIAIATLYLATHSGDDDDKKKKKQYYETLSLDNALGNILFIIDPSQMKYLIENPVAVKGTITKFIDALDGALHGDVKKAKKNAKKLIPYNKLVDQVDMLTGNNKKK